MDEPLIIETATPAGNLEVFEAYDVGDIVGVRLCAEATANLLPPEIINDCGVSVHLVKIAPRGGGGVKRHMCVLVANEINIGGVDREYQFYAKRNN